MSKYVPPDVDIKRKTKEIVETKAETKEIKQVKQEKISIEQPVPLSEVLELDGDVVTRALVNRISRYFDVLNGKEKVAEPYKVQLEWMKTVNLALTKPTEQCIIILDTIVKYMAKNPELIAARKIFSLNAELLKRKLYRSADMERYVRLMTALRTYALNIKNKARIATLIDIKGLTAVYGFGTQQGKNINTFFTLGYQ